MNAKHEQFSCGQEFSQTLGISMRAAFHSSATAIRLFDIDRALLGLCAFLLAPIAFISKFCT
jgi:hypothetical protein